MNIKGAHRERHLAVPGTERADEQPQQQSKRALLFRPPALE